MTDLPKTSVNVNAGDVVQLILPRSDMEHRLHEREPERQYRALSLYCGIRENMYARCLDLGEDGSTYGVWHFHVEALARAPPQEVRHE